jgi:hypothetical protein
MPRSVIVDLKPGREYGVLPYAAGEAGVANPGVARQVRRDC